MTPRITFPLFTFRVVHVFVAAGMNTAALEVRLNAAGKETREE
jgi:hypothetical protein